MMRLTSIISLGGMACACAQGDTWLGASSRERADRLATFFRASAIEHRDGTEPALAAFRQALQRFPTEWAFVERVTQLADSSGQGDTVREALESARKAAPKDARPLLALSRFWAATAATDPQAKAQAHLLARQAVEVAPQSMEAARHYLALLLADTQRDEASALVKRCLALSPDDESAWLDLAAMQYAVAGEMTPPIRTTLQKALAAKSPDAWRTREAVADFLLQAGDHAGALPHLEALVAAAPSRLAARQKLGLCLRLNGQSEAAQRVFLALLEIDDANSAAHRAMASMLEAAGQTKRALHHRMAMLRTDGGEPIEIEKLVNQLITQDLLEDARVILERGRATHPREPGLAIRLGLILEKLNRPKMAIAVFREASQLAIPSAVDRLDSAFYAAWARAAHACGETDAARIYAERAKRLAPPVKVR
jgi:tetratricopeptide (TPR) repeat protein